MSRDTKKNCESVETSYDGELQHLHLTPGQDELLNKFEGWCGKFSFSLSFFLFVGDSVNQSKLISISCVYSVCILSCLLTAWIFITPSSRIGFDYLVLIHQFPKL